VPQSDKELTHRLVLVVLIQDPVRGASVQESLPLEAPAEKPSGRRCEIRDLSADERRSQAVQDFLSTTIAERRVLNRAEEGAQSEASEWELRNGKRGKKRGGWRPSRWELRLRNAYSSPKPPLFLDFGGIGVRRFLLFLCCYFLGARYFSRDKPGLEGRGEAMASRKDSGRCISSWSGWSHAINE